MYTHAICYYTVKLVSVVNLPGFGLFNKLSCLYSLQVILCVCYHHCAINS